MILKETLVFAQRVKTEDTFSMSKLTPIFARYNTLVSNNPPDNREVLFFSGGETYISNRGEKRLHLFPDGTHDKYGAWISRSFVEVEWSDEDKIFLSQVDLGLLDVGNASLTLPHGSLTIGVINVLCEYSIMAICGISEALFCYFNPALMEFVRKASYADNLRMREKIVFSYFTGLLADPIVENPDYFALMAFHAPPDQYFKSLNVFPHVRKSFNLKIIEQMQPFVSGGEYMYSLPLMEDFNEILTHNFATGLKEFSLYSARCVSALSKGVVEVVSTVALAATSLAVSLFVNGISETYDVANERWGARVRASYGSFTKRMSNFKFSTWAGSLYERICTFFFWE